MRNATSDVQPDPARVLDTGKLTTIALPMGGAAILLVGAGRADLRPIATALETEGHLIGRAASGGLLDVIDVITCCYYFH